MEQPARRALRILFWAAIPFALAATLWIAFSTQINRHPDEILHLDAVRHFADHWLPPDLNADELVYGPGGWSRVHNGEIVYWLYGRLVAGLRMLAGWLALATGFDLRPQLHLPYNPLARLLNIILYAATLFVLAVAARRSPLALTLGLLLVATPQLVYVYSYVNSDAWGVSWVVFAALFATRAAPPLSRRGDGLFLGLLLSMLFLSKEPFWLAIPFLGALALFWPRSDGAFAWRRAVAKSAVAVIVVVLALLPWRVLFPLSQGDYAVRARETVEQRAWPGFSYSDPSAPSRFLRAKNVPFTTVATNTTWYSLSAQSFYGRFGFMAIALPAWAYALAALAATLGFVGTTTLVLRPQPYALALRLLLLCAVGSLLLGLVASLYHSWTVDLQPQGRYLFGSLPAVAVLLGAMPSADPPWLVRARLFAWLLLVAVGLGLVATTVPGHPLLV